MFVQLWREHRFVTSTLIVSFVLILAGWLWADRLLSPLGQPLILHYSSRARINQVGTIGDLRGLALLGVAIVVINGILAFYLDARDWFLGKFLATVTIAVSILLFIAFVAIVSVN